jgi:hypothetical protein
LKAKEKLEKQQQEHLAFMLRAAELLVQYHAKGGGLEHVKRKSENGQEATANA